MSVKHYTFQWFQREDRRRRLLASVSREGRLRLGGPLYRKLPPFIRTGFDRDARVLAIAEGRELDGDTPLSKTLNAQVLTAQLRTIGLTLPVAFTFLWDESTGYYLGTVLPRRRLDPHTGRRQYDPQQLLTLYAPMIDHTVTRLAKSTPLAERRAIAAEALCAALPAYRPGLGDLEAYLEEQIRRSLLAENRQYSLAYRDRSLDQPLTLEEGENFTLYHTTPGSDDGGIGQLEDRIMAQQFWATLSQEERTLSQLLQSGRSLGHIALRLGRTEAEIQRLGLDIGEKRRRFYLLS